MGGLALFDSKKKQDSGLQFNDDGYDLFSVATRAIKADRTLGDHVQKGAHLNPNEIGASIGVDLDYNPKDIVTQFGNRFEGRGMSPEAKAQMNTLANVILPKADEDAKFFTKNAKKIMDHSASIYESNVEHKRNAFEADLKLKAADVEHLGSIQSHQERTFSLLDRARERHSGIQYLAEAMAL